MSLGSMQSGYGGGSGDRNLKMSLSDTFRLAWADEDLQRRLKFILTIFAVYMLGIHIRVPIPGVNPALFEKTVSDSPLFAMMNTFGGGGLKRISVFALGLGPYITSSIIMQILTQANPAWKKELQEGGEYARKQQNKRTKMLMFVLSWFQGTTILKMIQQTGAIPTVSQGWFISVSVVLFWTAGSYFLLWLGEQLSEKGIGNGTSLLIFAGIVIVIPSQIELIVKNFGVLVQWWQVLAIVALFVGTTWFVVYFTLAQRRIPIQHMRRQMGTKVMGGGTNYLPFSVNMVGVIPIIFASALITMPGQFARAFPPNSKMFEILEGIQKFTYPDFSHWQGFVAALVYMALIFFFTYFYTAIQFNVDDISDNLKRSGSFIPGVRPGKQTRDFLDTIISRITVMGAGFLAIVSLSQYLVPVLIKISGLSMIFGTSLLIMVSVALETMRQIEANLIMKQYGL
ncbi:MAG: preprotein translocase subunit SecY [Armatimonadetes bacterium]|nr:preprotein translocase subunit SecY [Armatimonadota bacterium]